MSQPRRNSVTTLINSTTYSPELVDFAAHYMYTIWNDIPFDEPVSNLKHPLFSSFRMLICRTMKAAGLTNACIFLGLQLFSRVRAHMSSAALKPGTEASAFIASIVIASKLLMDNSYTNETWSKISGVSRATVNVLEREFLKLLDYNIHADDQIFFEKLYEMTTKLRVYKDIRSSRVIEMQKPVTEVSLGKMPIANPAGSLSPSHVMKDSIEIFRKTTL